MKKKILYLIVIFVFIIVIVLVCRGVLMAAPRVEDHIDISEPAIIKPDYTDIIIPPNIAPLNFRILDKSEGFVVTINSANGEPVSVFSRNGKIIIPAKKWRKLLAENMDSELYFDIYSEGIDGKWKKYPTITNKIAAEPIDEYLVFRFMKPIYNWWKDIGIYQRKLSSWDVSTVLHGRSFGEGCLNCHTFLNNRPESMTIGFRSNKYGSATVLATESSVSKIGAKWGYTSWHPSGRIAIYSINKVRQFFHSAGMEVRDVVDLDAAIAYYDVQNKKVKTAPALSEKDRLESYPTWSPDGRYLYYCSAPILWEDRDTIPPVNYEKVKYDLRRISYDIEKDQWGQPETILSAEKTGLSILLPRVSPDGRFLLFCMCQYGCFPVYQPTSDLYMMDLERGNYQKLNINSEYSESWHSFSSNGRWIAFSSKRRGGLFTRTYFSYVDTNGKAYKPFILPQKDPEYYDSLLQTYSVPEFITAPVKVSPKKLARAIRAEEKIDVAMPITGATPKTEASDPWRQRE